MNLNLSATKDVLIRTAGRTSLILQKYSPEILMGAGILGVIGTTILASRATLKVDAINAKFKEDAAKVQDMHDETNKDEALKEAYSDMDYRKDLVGVYAEATTKYIKLYAPALTLGILSVGCLLGSHGILQRRNVALMAGYKLIEEAYEKYRGRVADEYGTKVDNDFAHGVYSEEVNDHAVDEDGKKVKVKKTVSVAPDKTTSPYAVYFNKKTTIECTGDPIQDAYFLAAQQRFANSRLCAEGHLFLNDVYKMLGMEDTQNGQLVGWLIRDMEGRDKTDGYIDFDLYNLLNHTGRDFSRTDENGILLDFNVDGIIWDQI